MKPISKPDISQVKKYQQILKLIRDETSNLVVGQEEVVNGLIRTLLADGHVLVEGIPGIAKTLIVRTLAKVTGCQYSRIQFTADLLPTDIIGLTTYIKEKNEFKVIKGPVFANFVIADEINRAPPKCVLGETPIIMENGDIKSIKEIVKDHKGKILKRNNEEWIEPIKPLKLMSFNLKDYKIKPEEVKYLYRQRTKNPYHKIKLKTGREIKTSTEHPFFTLKDGRVKIIKSSEIKEGDCVLIPRNLRLEGNNILKYDEEFLKQSEEVRKEIERRKKLYKNIQKYKRLGIFADAIRNNLNISDLDKNLFITFLKSKPKYLDIENTEDYFFSKSKQFGQVSSIKKPVAVTKELACLTAILLSEGSVNKNYFYLTMKDQDIPIKFINDLEKVFGIKPKLLYDNTRKQYRVAFRSDALVKLFESLRFRIKRKSKDKEIPSFIMKADDENVKEFLRAYYEGDGCASRDCVKVTTKSRKMANSLSYLLLRMNLVGRISRELTKTKIGIYNYRRKFYNIRLYGGDLYKFYQNIGFLTEEKNRKLRGLIKNFERINVDLIPEMHGTLRVIRKSIGLTHEQFYDLTGMHVHNIENPKNALTLSRSRLLRITNSIAIENDSLNQLKNLLSGDYYCDFVRENKVIVPCKNYWLYDFSMKENHSFIAGFGGIISHNTQSALLESMQEKQVTIGNETFKLPDPFFVMATQNPIESSGVYSLPEAQIDRFLFKIKINYPKLHEENEILTKNITLQRFEEVRLEEVTDPKEIVRMQDFVKKIYLSKEVENYIVKLIDATRNPNKYKINNGQYIEWGCSPRGSIGLYIASKTQALIQGNNFVTPAHVKSIAHDVMRHRILLNYEGQAENIKTDDIITEILSKVQIP